jgi:Iap family predicted aminopeptidase
MNLRAVYYALVVVLVTPSFAQVRFSYELLNRELIETRLKASSRDDTEREAILKKMFADSGCSEHISEQPVKHVKQPDLICVLPGDSDKVIVVGAHFDHVNAGDGVVDNWSGASLLPSLYQGLHTHKPRHTFIFVSFSGEEKGELGSASYVKNMAEQDVARTQAMVNMDTLGLGTTAVWYSHSDPKLVAALAATGKTLSIPIKAVNVEAVGSTDSEQFAKRKIPRITIHSVTQETWSILHSRRDKLSAVKLDDYYTSYKLIAAYMAYLDQTLPIKK